MSLRTWWFEIGLVWFFARLGRRKFKKHAEDKVGQLLAMFLDKYSYETYLLTIIKSLNSTTLKSSSQNG